MQFPYESDIPKYAPRLLKIVIRRKYNWAGPQYVLPRMQGGRSRCLNICNQNVGFPCENNFLGATSNVLKIGAHREHNWIGPRHLTQNCADFHMEILLQRAARDYFKKKKNDRL